MVGRRLVPPQPGRPLPRLVLHGRATTPGGFVDDGRISCPLPIKKGAGQSPDNRALFINFSLPPLRVKYYLQVLFLLVYLRPGSLAGKKNRQPAVGFTTITGKPPRERQKDLPGHGYRTRTLVFRFSLPNRSGHRPRIFQTSIHLYTVLTCLPTKPIRKLILKGPTASFSFFPRFFSVPASRFRRKNAWTQTWILLDNLPNS